jgi:hypothetical protein
MAGPAIQCQHSIQEIVIEEVYLIRIVYVLWLISLMLVASQAMGLS